MFYILDPGTLEIPWDSGAEKILVGQNWRFKRFVISGVKITSRFLGVPERLGGLGGLVVLDPRTLGIPWGSGAEKIGKNDVDKSNV